jgi:hypothetical protein
MSSIVYFLSKLPQSVKFKIFDEIPLTEYKNVRLVCRYFYGIIQLKVDILEAECEKNIQIKRQEIIQTAQIEQEQFRNGQLNRIKRKRIPNPDKWLTIEAWEKQTLHVPLHPFWTAEEAWYKLHKQLYETDRFFCPYCVRVGWRDEMVRLPLIKIGVHRKWTEFAPRHLQLMRHSFHRSCYNHWRQWLSFHGRAELLGSEHFCCRCQAIEKEITAEEGTYLVQVNHANFGLMVNRFYLEPYSDVEKLCNKVDTPTENLEEILSSLHIS